jgi:hypothetical protein
VVLAIGWDHATAHITLVPGMPIQLFFGGVGTLVGYPVHLVAEALPEAIERQDIGKDATEAYLRGKMPYLDGSEYGLLVERSGRTDAPVDDRSQGGSAGSFFRKPRVSEEVRLYWER